MRCTGILFATALAALGAGDAMGQLQLPGSAIRPPPEQDSPLTRPIAPPVSRRPAEGSNVAETLEKAGIRPTRQALTGLDEKAADSALFAIEEKSGLPRELRDLQDKPPANSEAIARSLGLHGPAARSTDFRGRTPSVDEIVDALKPQ